MNAYKLQPSLSEMAVVDWHGSQHYILVSKLKKAKTKFLRCTGYLNSIEIPYTTRFIANSSFCTTTNFLNC